MHLLLERLRGNVVLPGGASSYFAYKMSGDAAVVKRAKRGKKKWTTLIVQIINPLIKQLLELQQQGLTVGEMLMPMPPCVITFGAGVIGSIAPPASVRGHARP